jgi:uncharacterized OB-fold protein
MEGMKKEHIDSEAGQQIPVAEGLFTSISGEHHLIGSKCLNCGEVFFPSQDVCGFCSTIGTEKVTFSNKGTLDLFVCSRYPTPGYFGRSPLSVGFVKLPEGTKIIAPLVVNDISELKMGMQVKMVLVPFKAEAQGSNEVIGFAFKPA